MKSSIDKFTVVIEEPSRTFSPGDRVHGKVVLGVKQELKLSKVKMECRGEAYVSWPENNGTYTRYHYAREKLFCVKSCVYGDTEENTKGKGASVSVLKPSVYSFSFGFTIPNKDLPPSYEAKYGYIRYGIQASIQKKKGKNGLKTAEEVFTVGNYNEYDEEELVELKDFELKFINGKGTTVSLGGSCYPTGLLHLSAHTNKCFYHPGEVIITCVSTDNEANRGVHAVEASLIRLTAFNDGKNNKTYSKKEVVRVEKEFRLVTEEDLELILPAELLQPTMLLGCKYIAINYYVQVRLKINGKAQKEPALVIPVVVVPSQVLPSPTTQTDSGFRSNSFFTDSGSTNGSSRLSPPSSTTTVCYTNTGYITDEQKNEVLDTCF